MGLSNRRGQAVERLRQLATQSQEGGQHGIPVPMMIEAVVGPAYDDELETLVRQALSANREGMTLREIAIGILSLEDWRVSQS